MRARSEEEVKKILDELKITVKGKDVPRPVTTFDEAKFPKYIMETLQQQENFVKPSAIQSQGWPIAMSGRDLVGIAETGSGKTLAFLLPAIVHVNAQEMLEVSLQTLTHWTFMSPNSLTINIYHILKHFYRKVKALLYL